MYKVEIYKKGITYSSAITINMQSIKRLRELEEILLETGHTYRVQPVEDEPKKEGVKDNDF